MPFGSNKLSKETKDAMLYGQLQEGLRLSIIRSPSVLGTLAYKELCMAAKHKGKRKVELRKHQESEQLTATKDNQQRDNRQKQDRRTSNRGDAPVSGNEPSSQVGTKNNGNKVLYLQSNRTLG